MLLKLCRKADGAALPSSPAAAETILGFFKDTGMKPSDFDLIATGDLGVIGSQLLLELLDKEGLNIRNQHTDCGKLIYDMKAQNTPNGASGCGCSGAVLTTAFLKPLSEGSLKNILFVPTGALMSPVTVFQKESIPAIAHLVWLSHERS